jgi:amino acid adenylation domain-containing protein
MNVIYEETIQGYRLSSQQKRLWLLQQAVDSLAFRAQCAILIEGRLDVAVLTEALKRLIARHHILRTTFHCYHGMTIPVQVITDGRMRLDGEYEFRCLSREEETAVVRETMRKARQIAVDYESGPALRWSFLHLSESRKALIITLPGLWIDSIGLRNLLRCLSETYEALRCNKVPAGESLQYITESEWQNDLFESEDFEPGRSYWLRQYRANANAFQLPFDKQAGKEFRPECLVKVIDLIRSSRIEDVAECHGTRLSTFLLACWQLLLGRLSGQGEIVIGVSCDRRADEESEGMLGPFAKYLPIWSQWNELGKFSDLLDRLNESVCEAQDWQEWFDWSEFEGDVGETAGMKFFPLCFDYQEETDSYRSGEVTFSIFEQYVCIDRFELKLSCVVTKDGIKAEIHYNSAIFEMAEVERIGRYYEALLESAIRNVDGVIGELDILTPDDLRQLILDFNDTRSETLHDATVQELFEEQVARTPDTIAAVFEAKSLTYAELNRRANRLAHYLSKEGVTTESVVAICFERSQEMLVSVLGVIKAGAAYAPMDPSHPIDRLAFVLQDSRASILLTQENLSDLFLDQEVKKICLDSDRGTICHEIEENINGGTVAKNAAYVIYTSGSTGYPKGVMVEHHSLINLLAALRRAVYAKHSEQTLLISLNAPLTFDASLQQIVRLMCGDTLHIVPQETRLDGKSLLSYLITHRIDIFDCTPSQLAVLLEAGLLQTDVFALQAILVAGEAIDGNMWNDLSRSSGPTFYNIYGPTECTVDATSYCLNGESDGPSIGYPLANYQIHVLDSQLRLEPIGVRGEFYIGGAGLARCYLNQPLLTAERFIPNPFSSIPGERLYKTGDTGRRMPDGNLEYIGRIDNQIKIRGYRVELGEVESVLNQHPAVQQAVVIAQKDGSVVSRLLAFIVPSDKRPGLEIELMNYAQARLPEYMLPSMWVLLDFMPLTPNGKIDRNALHVPEVWEAERATKLEAPKTQTEELVAGLWSNLLGLKQVGRFDNFFSLGGHSLLAAQVITRVREAFQVNLPLRSVFESPTVADFAAMVALAMEEAILGAPPMQPAPPNKFYPLSYEQLQIWLREQTMPAGSGSYISGSLRQEEGKYNLVSLEQSMAEIVRRHEALRTTFPIIEGQPVQWIGPAKPMRLPVADLSNLSEREKKAEFRRWALSNIQRPFDLATGPLIRARLINLSDKQQVLHYTIHHIIADIWSMDIINRELAEFFGIYSQGLASPLDELTLKYVDYAVWQREHLTSGALQKHLQYWKQQLAGVPTVLSLPTDRPRSQIQTYRGAWQHLLISRNIADQLSALSSQEGVTMFMALLAVFQTLLCRYSGQSDICVGSPMTFRERREMEGVIGYFTNIVALRAQLEGNPSFRELLKQIREVTLKAYTYQDLPYVKLLDEVKPGQDGSREPLFHVWFNFIRKSKLSPSDFEYATGLLDVEERENNTASFDLTMVITELSPGLKVALEYNKDLFEPSRIRNMLCQFQSLIERMIAYPDERILDFVLPTHNIA